MKNSLQFPLSALIVSAALSSGAFAAEIPVECAQGKAIFCSEDGTAGEYLDCADRKLSLIKICRQKMKDTLKGLQKQVIDYIDDAAGEVTSDQERKLAEIDSHLTALSAINEENQERFRKIGERFAGFVKEFETEMKPTLSSYPPVYQDFAAAINKVTVGNNYDERLTLQKDEVGIQKAYSEHMNYLSSVRSKISLIRNELSFFTSEYLRETQVHKPFLADRGYQDLIFDTEPYIQLLNKADNSVLRMMDEVNLARDQLGQRITITTNSLVEQYVLKKTKKTIDDVNHMRASSNFLAQVNERSKNAFVDSGGLSINGLPLFTERYKALKTFINFASICQTEVKSSWMVTGCSFALEKLDAAKKSIKQMPSNMQIGLSIAGSKSSSSAVQSDSIKSALKASDLGQAVVMYDAMIKEVFR
ncbi:MAG: hypothetical protein H7318_08480 [Oligoflexus sp.]|nr:hypothetical protein [Oligoflexus sp.]